MSNHKSHNEETINQFKDYFETSTEDMNPTFQKSTILVSEKFHEMILGDKDLELTALDIKLNKSFKRKSSKFLNEIKDQNLSNSLKKIGVLSEPNENVLIVRKMPKITNDQYDKLEKEYIYKDNKNIIKNLYDYLTNVNCYFRNPNCLNSVSGINPLTYLVEVSFHMNFKKIKEIKEKYNLLSKYINNYREINGDGNCFYRAIMFRYIEILILTANIPVFQQFIFDIIESFKSEEMQNRRLIRNNDIKPELTFQILFLIINILKQKNIKEAHQLFVKCISTCKKFDYCLILYLRYIIYKYIKKNENKLYTKSFPLKIGNLLPQQFENEKGEFLFNSFYEDYLLKFFTDAEKIIIYIVPFVLGIQLNVVVYDIVDDEIIQKFLWEGESDIKSKDVITLLNNKNHYSLVYTEFDNNKYQTYFEFYKTNIKSVVLEKSIAPNMLNYEMDDKSSLNEGLNEINNYKGDNKIRNMVIENNNINNIQKHENKSKINNSNKFEKENKINTIEEKKEINNIINNNKENNNNKIFNDNININNNNLEEQKQEQENLNKKFNYLNKTDLKKGINMTDSENILSPHLGMEKNVHQNVIKSEINKIRHNIDNNESMEYEEKNNLNNRQPKNDNKKNEEKNNLNHNKISKNKPKSGDTKKEKLKEKHNTATIENKKLQNKENKIKTNTEKKETHKNKENTNHKSNHVCLICSNKIKINEKNPLCKYCFKNELIKQYFDCFQDNRDPKENIYFKLKGKIYNLEQIIKLYNESYENSEIDYQIILKNIEEKKCILCTLKNDILLPCKCCKYCVHINTYFKNCDLKNRFTCPNKVNYSREQMFKLAIKLHKMLEWKNNITSIINYFNRRLNSNCCLCGEKLENEKFVVIVRDPNKDEDSNKFLSKIDHYFCTKCRKNNKSQKEFKCYICQIKHSY